jgi:hypothetical protein
VHIKWLSGWKNGLASGRKVKKSFTFFEAELYQEISLFIFSIGWFQHSYGDVVLAARIPLILLFLFIVVYMLPFSSL